VAGLNSAGGMAQNEVPRSVNVDAWIGATSNSVRASSRLQLTMAFFRSATEERTQISWWHLSFFLAHRQAGCDPGWQHF
jgi:hypothetical protein